MDLQDKIYTSNTPLVAPQTNRFKSFVQSGRLEYSPLWMMRQAGRYLPEYHLLKSKAHNFLKACKTPKIASEITLQPLRRFELDAAIIFSDILVILECFGYSISFDGTGPQISHKLTLEQITEYYEDNVDTQLDYVSQAIEVTANALHNNHSLIGFCGAPWTVALYAFDQKRSPFWSEALSFIYKNEEQVHKFFKVLTHASMEYLSRQVNAGAHMVMIFDSWIAHAPQRYLDELALKYADKLIHDFKKRHPHIAVIYYPKGKTEYAVGIKMPKDCDIFALDNNESIVQIQPKTSYTLQGNFDNRILLTSPEIIQKEVKRFCQQITQPIVLNLSHGILKDTPVQNVQAFVKSIREHSELLSVDPRAS